MNVIEDEVEENPDPIVVSDLHKFTKAGVCTGVHIAQAGLDFAALGRPVAVVGAE